MSLNKKLHIFPPLEQHLQDLTAGGSTLSVGMTFQWFVIHTKLGQRWSIG
jgi:hypothetical protein